MRTLVVLASMGVLAAAAATARASDEPLLPGGTLQSSVFPGDEVENWRVTAPAGSVLGVDFRAARGSGVLLEVEGIDPIEVRPRMKIAFAQDGEVVLRISSPGGTPGDYRLRTRLKAPRPFPVSGTIGGPGETGLAGFFTAPNALATVRVRRDGAGDLVPRVIAVDGPSGPAAAAATKPTPVSDLWKKVPLDEGGGCLATLGGDGSTTGAYTGSIALRFLRGPSQDRRVRLDPGALAGTYDAWLAVSPSTAFPAGALLSGKLTFDGSGGVAAALDTLALTPDAGEPLAFSLGTTPLPPGTGTYATDGARAVVSIAAGGGAGLELDLQVAAGATVLYPDPLGGTGTIGLLSRAGPAPTPANLAGSWFYIDSRSAGDGTGSVEAGSITLGSTGTATGFGSRTPLTTDTGGNLVPGTPVGLFRAGTFAVNGDGTVTVTTTENLFAPVSTWSVRPTFGNDALAPADPADLSQAQFLLRQGTGLANADFQGPYLHLGFTSGTGGAATARTGILTLDGAGAFAGTESATALPGGAPAAPAPVSGTYSVTAQGIATLTFAGGAAGTGVYGPEARYLLAVSLGSGGLGLDFLLRAQ